MVCTASNRFCRSCGVRVLRQSGMASTRLPRYHWSASHHAEPVGVSISSPAPSGRSGNRRIRTAVVDRQVRIALQEAADNENQSMEVRVSTTRETVTLSGSVGKSFLGIAVSVACGSSAAADPILPPPYQMAGTNHVLIGVVWDEAAVRKVLPPGITPVKDMTGGINIYQAERGYVIGPYQSAYFWVDVEGFDSPEGIKGRWMLAGVYGPVSYTHLTLPTNREV